MRCPRTGKPYDPVGAMGGLFAPAYIHGNPEARRQQRNGRLKISP